MSAARKTSRLDRPQAFWLSFCVAGCPLHAVAENLSVEEFPEIETHHIFGFTDGSDIAPEGHEELQLITRIDQGRRAIVPQWPIGDDFIAKTMRGGAQGAYRMIEQGVEFERAATKSFEYSFGAAALSHRIRGVDGFDDYTGSNFKGFFAEFRYVLAKRGQDLPIGVTIQTQPEWARASDATGRQGTAYGASSRLVVDAELIPRRLYAAINVIYEPELWRATDDSGWRRASTLALTAGSVFRVTPQLALGWGLQYYRAHSGLGLTHLQGQALFGGPTLYLEITDKLFVSAAFSTQLRGRAVGENHALNLTDFTSRMGWLLVGFEF